MTAVAAVAALLLLVSCLLLLLLCISLGVAGLCPGACSPAQGALA